MKLYAFLILATIVSRNEVTAHRDYETTSQNGLQKTVAELAKLIHMVNEYGVKDDDEEGNDEPFKRSEDSSDNTPTIVSRNEVTAHRDYETTSQNGLQKTVAELAKLIHMVNEYGVKDDDEEGNDEPFKRSEDSSDNTPIDLDYFMGRNNNPQLIKAVIGLLQKNYDAHKAQERQSDRHQIIRNPEVLEEYQKLIKRRHKSHQSSDEYGETRNDFKNIMDQRRNAVFRLDVSSMENEEIARSSEGSRTKRKPKSPDNDQSDYSDKKKSFDDDKKDDRIKFGDDIKNNDFNDKTRDTIDVYIDDVLQVKRKKGKEDYDLKQDNAWDVITKKYDWNEKDTRSDDTNKRQKKLKNDNIDEWNKITKQDSNDRDKEIVKTEKSYNDKPRRDKRGKRKRDSSKRKKSKMNHKSYERKQSKNKDFEDYDRPKKDKKNRESDWDTTPYALTTFRTTKMRKKEMQDDKPYAPKIPSYYSNPRPKKHANYDNSGFFGRTPIPYVGRQGIYVEK